MQLDPAAVAATSGLPASQLTAQSPPTTPVLAVTDTPDDRQDAPPVSLTSLTSSRQSVFLPVVRR